VRSFWTALNRIGESGAPRMEWRRILGADFDLASGLLHGTDIAVVIPDPGTEARFLEIDENDDGSFLALSMEFPPHRNALRLPRRDVVILIPNIAAISAFLAEKLGFNAGSHGQTRVQNLWELGTYIDGRKQPQPVFLFLPSLRPRSIALKDALLSVEKAIVLLPCIELVTSDLLALAGRREIIIGPLAELRRIEDLSIAPPSKVARSKRSLRALITPRNGWVWKDLRLSFDNTHLRATIHDHQVRVAWRDLRIKPLSKGKFVGPMATLSRLAAGTHMKQGRRFEKERQELSKLRKLLRALFPLPGKPYQKFIDGWGLAFVVDLSAAEAKLARQCAAEPADEDAFPVQPSTLDPADLDKYTIHQT